MDRRKKIINFSEAKTERRLIKVANQNAARVCPKMRIADVLDIDHSGISNERYRYALQAHFDFVVVNAESSLPLFAVEFDGPQHSDPDQAHRDRMKNEICERLGLPLARVGDEHIHKQVRDMDFLTWLTEVFFCSKSFDEAQAEGQVQSDEIFMPELAASIGVSSRLFPLSRAAEARTKFPTWFREGAIENRMPLHLSGYTEDGEALALVVVGVVGGLVWSGSRIYLGHGFGASAREAAEDLAVIRLAEKAHEVLEMQRKPGSSAQFRDILIRFLEKTRGNCFSAGSAKGALGFTFSCSTTPGEFRGWRVGPLGDEPEVKIPKKQLG